MRNKTRKQPSGYIQPGEPICHPRVRSKGRSRGQCFDTQTRRRIRGSQVGACHPHDDLCLLRESSLPEAQKKLLKKKWFRPEAPAEWKQKPDTWLTNEDIEKTMKQYEEAFPEFRFLGAVPIDFSAPDPYIHSESGSGGGGALGEKCMVQEFCKVNLKECIASGKKVLGAVFNLDPHYKGGSHWVGLVIRPTEGVYYFDSYGLPPPLQIARFMRNLTLQNPKLVLASNGRRFQYSNTECGMYSLYFIIRMLFGQDFKAFCKHRIADKYMLQLRKVLFLGAYH